MDGQETTAPTKRRSFVNPLRNAWVRAGVAAVLIAGAVAAGLTLAGRASAASLHVCHTGCPYSDIQSAINAAHNGDTIIVDAGTYTVSSPITVNKSVTLRGANAGTCGTCSRGAESIIDGTPDTNTNFGYDLYLTTTNITVNGFTIQNGISAGVAGGGTLDGLSFIDNIVQNNTAGLIEFGGTGLTIAHNLFLNNLGTNATTINLPVSGDAIYDDFAHTNVSITDNTIDGSSQAITEVMLPTYTQATVHIDNNLLQNGTFIFNENGTFNNNVVTPNAAAATPYGESTFGVYLLGQVSHFTVHGNTFSHLGATNIGAFTETIYGYTDNSNLTITGNTVTLNNGDISDPSNADLITLTDVLGTTHVTGNRIVQQGRLANGVTAIHDIVLAGHMHTVDVSNNVLFGGAATGTTGVWLDDLTSVARVSLTGNYVGFFQYGILGAQIHSSHASEGGAQNCIVGNRSYGADNSASGPTLSLEQNYWGSPTGPAPYGHGNPVSSNVDALHWLTTAPHYCASPPIVAP